MDEHPEMLITTYSRYGGLVSTAIRTTEKCPVESGFVPPDLRAVYASSRFVEGRKIVYGSIPHTIDEAARPIFRAQRFLRERHEAESRGRYSGRALDLGGNSRSYELLPGDDTDAYLHRQEAVLKDALLLSGIHVRTLLEDISGIGNLPVPVYDRRGHKVGEVSLARVFNTLAHYRYCVVSGPFVHDVFSKQTQLGPDDLSGTKMKINEVGDAVLEFISNIRVRDFVGVLRARLEKLSIRSSRRDMMFVVQNVQALERVVCDRSLPGDIPEFMQFLAERAGVGKERLVPDTDFTNLSSSNWLRRTGIPNFQIASVLSSKMIQMDLALSEDEIVARRVAMFSWDEFFGRLVQAHGNEPLVLYGVLRSRVEALDNAGR